MGAFWSGAQVLGELRLSVLGLEFAFWVGLKFWVWGLGLGLGWCLDLEKHRHLSPQPQRRWVDGTLKAVQCIYCDVNCVLKGPWAP